jgi:glutamate-5-semialdehyde dehydrogenase
MSSVEPAVTADELRATMTALGRAAVAARVSLAESSTAQRNRALVAAAAGIRARREEIKAANAADMALATARGLSAAMLDRLKLDDRRIEAMAKGLEDIAALPDPLGSVAAEWSRPNGLAIQRVRVPLGVIGIIYESRPNVTADAGALCLKSGNPVILRGGSESRQSSAAIHACLVSGLTAAAIVYGVAVAWFSVESIKRVIQGRMNDAKGTCTATECRRIDNHLRPWHGPSCRGCDRDRSRQGRQVALRGGPQRANHAD